MQRAMSARINFLSADRADPQYCSKEARRNMFASTRGDSAKLNRIGIYLLHKKRVAHIYKWQAPCSSTSIQVDWNGAGCLRTRRSTTGMCILHGDHLIRSISRTQANVALSSAEAELYAMVHAGSEGLGARAMGLDVGRDLSPHLHVDASIAIGIAQRKGFGKVRHLDAQSFWSRDALRDRRLQLHKIAGKENAGDVLTKTLDSKTLEYLMGRVGLVSLSDRPAASPELTKDYDGQKTGEGGRQHREDGSAWSRRWRSRCVGQTDTCLCCPGCRFLMSGLSGLLLSDAELCDGYAEPC